MAKKVMAQIKIHVQAGKANPSPPIGPALGQHGVNIMDFCRAFNEKTAKSAGFIIPVVITVYKDRTFSFITKKPPASRLLTAAAKIEKGSGEPNREKVGTITKDQLLEIAKTKQEDLNASTDEAAMNIIAGTARSMGIEIV